MSLRDRVRQAAEDRRSAQRFKIRRYLLAHGPTSDYVLTKETGISAGTVLVRLHELESVGDVICERVSRPDDPTRFRHLWRMDREGAPVTQIPSAGLPDRVPPLPMPSESDRSGRESVASLERTA
jgi:predicted ArsR family transcriptional regulator